MKRILFVDDEKQILKALNRLFMETEYEVELAESGNEALEKLADSEFDLIVSDMRMPVMDGYELLSRVKQLYPNIIRIMLSGYCDNDIIIKALQKNIAMIYIFKPWENDVILKLVEHIFQTEDTLKSKNLLRIMNNVDNLPTIKKRYERVISLIDDDADNFEISTEIESDYAIASKVLQVANSAYYGKKIGSVRKAVSYIGLANTYSIVRATSVLDSMKGLEANDQKFDSIWKHAFIANKLLGFFFEEHLHKKLPELYSTAGLFQNIGCSLLLKQYKEEYMEVFERSITERIDLQKIEKEKFGITHSEAGAYLLRWWDFPYPIIEAAMYHHNPLDENVINSELIFAVHLTNSYASQMLGDLLVVKLDEEVFNRLNVSKNEFEMSLTRFEV